jgi:hypothetical protein
MRRQTHDDQQPAPAERLHRNHLSLQCMWPHRNRKGAKEGEAMKTTPILLVSRLKKPDGVCCGADLPPGWENNLCEPELEPEPSPKPAGPTVGEQWLSVGQILLDGIDTIIKLFLLFLWKFIEYHPSNPEPSRKK